MAPHPAQRVCLGPQLRPAVSRGPGFGSHQPGPKYPLPHRAQAEALFGGWLHRACFMLPAGKRRPLAALLQLVAEGPALVPALQAAELPGLTSGGNALGFASGAGLPARKLPGFAGSAGRTAEQSILRQPPRELQRPPAALSPRNTRGLRRLSRDAGWRQVGASARPAGKAPAAPPRPAYPKRGGPSVQKRGFAGRPCCAGSEWGREGRPMEIPGKPRRPMPVNPCEGRRTRALGGSPIQAGNPCETAEPALRRLPAFPRKCRRVRAPRTAGLLRAEPWRAAPTEPDFGSPPGPGPRFAPLQAPRLPGRLRRSRGPRC